jgi:hypothetical protein
MVFEPIPGKPGTSRFVRWMTPDEVKREIRAALKAKGLGDEWEREIDLRDLECLACDGVDCRPSGIHRAGCRPWRVVIFVTQGTSEGWYIHLAALFRADHEVRWIDLGHGKTFNRDFAWAVARAIEERFQL